MLRVVRGLRVTPIMGAVYAGSLAVGGSTIHVLPADPRVRIVAASADRIHLEVSVAAGFAVELLELVWTVGDRTRRIAVAKTIRGITPIVVAIDSGSPLPTDVHIRYRHAAIQSY